MSAPVALVTGAARGIGAATVRRLVADGWLVTAVDVCEDDPSLPYPLATRADLDAVVATDVHRVAPFVADVRNLPALIDAVAETQSRYGGLDAVVGCAGAIAGGTEQWRLHQDQESVLIDINLRGWLNTARAAVPALLLRKAPRRGRLLVVASAAAKQGLPMLAAYCAAKAAVVGAVRAQALELADEGITVNAVSPGSTATAMLDATATLYDLREAQDFAAQQPLQRLVSPDEVAATIAFLLSTDAAAITGADVPVDAGMHL